MDTLGPQDRFGTLLWQAPVSLHSLVLPRTWLQHGALLTTVVARRGKVGDNHQRPGLVTRRHGDNPSMIGAFVLFFFHEARFARPA